MAGPMLEITYRLLFVPQVGLEPTRYCYFATVSKTVMCYQFQH